MGAMATPPMIAQIRYDTPDFEVLRAGTHVRCAVSGELIPLDSLLYWSVEYQEAYRSAVEAGAAAKAGGAAKLTAAAN